MKSTSNFFAIVTAFILLFGAFNVIQAQTFDPVGTGVINQQISTKVTPENPLPGQSVTISVEAYGTDLNAASISWSVDGKVAQKGTGLTQFSVTAGKNGETKSVVVTISPTSGPLITKSFSISAQEVSIIYESDGYTPPFYRGKGVYAREGTIKLVAMPNLMTSSGARLDPNTLTYKWIVDDTVQGSKSGYGKSTFYYTGSILGKDTIVSVEVSSASGLTKGKGTILLTPLSPEVLVYEHNPLYGTMFNRELASRGFSLNGKEVTLNAIPFSTSASDINDGTLEFVWSINNSTIPVPKTQSTATFRNSTDQSGSSLIAVTVNNTTHLLQSIRNSLSINF